MFVNTEYFSPVRLYGHTQAPVNSYEWREWWKEEERRCLNGYSVGGVRITGRHYHYLNYWPMRRRDEKTGIKRIGLPRFLDIDYEFYHQVEKCIDEGKDGLWLKRRQAGYTYKTGQLGGYNFTHVPDSYTIFTSGLAEYSETSFKFMVSSLDLAAGTPFYRHRMNPNETFHIHAQYRQSIDGVDRMLGYHSEAKQITATSPQALVGKSPSLVIYEEIGKFPGFLDVKSYTDAGLETEGIRTGLSLFIGTGGEENESIDEVAEAFYNPDKYNFYAVDNVWDTEEGEAVIDPLNKPKSCFFVAGWRFLKVDKDGNSLEKESRDEINRRRKSKEGSKGLLKEITQYPLTPQEALLTPDGGRFNVVKLRQRRLQILRSPELKSRVQTGDIEWVYGSGGSIVGTTFVPKHDGPFRITEHPDTTQDGTIPDCYVAGTDSYDRDQTVDGKGSLGSCYVFKKLWSATRPYNMFVASITQRPETSQEFYENTAKLCVHYGWAKNLIEYSMVNIIDWYIRNNFIDLLRERPEIVYQAQISPGPNNRFGVDPATKPIWITKLADHIEKNADTFCDLDDIAALIKYKDKLPSGKPYNCDRTIAMSLAVLHAADDMEGTTNVQHKPYELKMRRFVHRNGRIVRLNS